jgi:hypothetical protein
MMQRSEFHPFDRTQICYEAVGLTNIANGNWLAIQFDFKCRHQRRIGKRCLTHVPHRNAFVVFPRVTAEVWYWSSSRLQQWSPRRIGQACDDDKALDLTLLESRQELVVVLD